MSLQPVQLYGITRDDIQEIVHRTIQDFIEEMKSLPRIILFDTSYLYNFDLVDFEYVKQFNMLGRYNNKYVLEWHRCLERWGQDQTVHIFDRPIKPLHLSRTVDRVPNEGLIHIGGAYTGRDFEVMRWHAVGVGADPDHDVASPAAKGLIDQTSRINVEESPDGGSLSREGSTIYIVGNHPKTIETGNYTESGVFDAEATTNDRMGDYSVFPDPVPHDEGEDAVGSTTVIYMCST